MKRTTPTALACGAVLAATLWHGTAAAVTLKSEGGTPSGLSTLVQQLISKHASPMYKIDVKVNTGQTLTRSLVSVATGTIDLATTPAGAYAAMTKGVGPYQKMGDKAVEASRNVRSLFAFLGGHYHPITYADSGITRFEDIKGKRVFVGPPAGTASRETMAIIKLVTGYEAGTDYEAVKLDWGAANQAFEDGAFDLFIRPGPIGTALVDQFGRARKIRIIGIPEGIDDLPGWRDWAKVPGRAIDPIPAGTYANQVGNDKPVRAGAFVMMVTVNAKMDDDLAYKLTAAFFENLDDVHKVSKGFAGVTLQSAFDNLIAPLHPGAARYFREKGVTIPQHLLAAN